MEPDYRVTVFAHHWLARNTLAVTFPSLGGADSTKARAGLWCRIWATPLSMTSLCLILDDWESGG